MTDINRLVTEQPAGWQYRLAAALLREGLSGPNQQLADLQRGAIFRTTKYLTVDEYSRWGQERIDDLVALAELIVTTLEDDLTPACRDAVEAGPVRQAVDRLLAAGEQLAAWEIEVHFTRVADLEVQAVKALMDGWAAALLRQLGQLSDELERLVERAEPGQSYTLPLTFTPPAGVSEYNQAMNRLTRQRQAASGQSGLSCFQVLAAILVIGVIVLCLLAGGAG